MSFLSFLSFFHFSQSNRYNQVHRLEKAGYFRNVKKSESRCWKYIADLQRNNENQELVVNLLPLRVDSLLIFIVRLAFNVSITLSLLLYYNKIIPHDLKALFLTTMTAMFLNDCTPPTKNDCSYQERGPCLITFLFHWQLLGLDCLI